MIGKCAWRALALAVALAGRANAGDITGCYSPYAFENAVNVYVLEDGEAGASDALRQTRRRLAWLVELDTLFRDSYGSLGAHLLVQQDYERPCTLDTIINPILGVLPAGGAVALVEQRVYSEGDNIVVQSYLRFLRTNTAKRVTDEVVAYVPRTGSLEFSELLPTQRLAFAPRQLTTGDLSAIGEGFAKASRLYPDPSYGKPGREMPFSLDHPLPFLITEARPDGWMHVDGSRFAGGDYVGWLRADPELSARLRHLLPELDFLDGAIGYLSYREAREHGFLPMSPQGIAQRAKRALGRSAELGDERGESTTAAGVAAALDFAMAADNIASGRVAVANLFAAVSHSAPDSRLRDLLGMARVVACCSEAPTVDNDRDRATRLVALSAALNDFQAALAIDPANERALANLDTLYRLPAFAALVSSDRPPPLPAEVCTTVGEKVTCQPNDDPLRSAYERAIARLPQSRAELDQRSGEIQALQRSLSK